MDTSSSWLDRATRFCLENPLVVGLVALLLALGGVLVAPFDWELGDLPRNPVPVDAIPDTGENQQIVFTEWPGRSPQDVEDQVTYPLTTALLGVAGVKSVRSNSMFGFSSIYVIFEEGIEFYWSRSRLLEKLASLSAGTLPADAQPALGPDATALGQVFWYTLEGQDSDGRPTGGWDPQELRSIQDWYVRYALSSVAGVAEVASIGGFVKEYQIDVDPDAMRAYGVTLGQVFRAVRESNADVGARTIEVNRAEYVVRGLGLLEGTEDIEDIVVGVTDNVPITIRQIASVSLGPALRRGALEKNGTEAVGAVIVARYGANPMAVLNRVRDKIAELSPGLPEKTLADGTVSRVAVVPFYDRSGLIHETLGTLESALEHEILVTVVVVLVLLGSWRSAVLVAGLLPLAVLMCFLGMKVGGVDANVVALAGIAIAIGTMVDVGIVLVESVQRQLSAPSTEGLSRADARRERLERVHAGVREVSGAVLTAVLTTIVSFLPVFAMLGAEGKLFKPLAFTKTAALVASIVVALALLPSLARLLLRGGVPGRASRFLRWILAGAFALLLADLWHPVGAGRTVLNIVFTFGILGGVLFGFFLLMRYYEFVLRWCLANKLAFLTMPGGLVVLGILAWLGVERAAYPVTSLLGTEAREDLESSGAWSTLAETFPGLGREFLPALDEGSFLLMPVTMAHASIGEAYELIEEQDRRLRAIPEVQDVVGKIGRVDSALDPAPISMVETLITYAPEFVSDAAGRPLRFAVDPESGEHARDAEGQLVPDEDGRPFRQWRDAIRTPDDIWEAIAEAARLPGMTTTSKLQPIETRRIMLQTGMRAPMGIKVFGPDLETLEAAALALEAQLKLVPSVRPETVLADRLVGKPYLEIDIDRKAIARYGMSVRDVQDVIEVAIGGRRLTTAVEGRERYPVRVRYMRELRDQVEELERILVAAPDGTQIPLGALSDIRYTPGPQSIKSEDTFLVAYVLFDKQPGFAEVDVVEDAKRALEAQAASGALQLPAGISYRFAGNYENELRANATLRLVIPLALALIFLLIYLLFRSALTTGLVFTGVLVAWSGGFLLLWLYGQEGFLDFSVLGINLRELFGVRSYNLSVAVWVGFLALFGIATDDGVLMASYLKQTFERERPATREAVREAVVHAGLRRVRPCLLTTATTLLALVPVLTSRGRGADILAPMALPTFGGMLVALISIFVVPTLYAAIEEWRVRGTSPRAESGS